MGAPTSGWLLLLQSILRTPNENSKVISVAEQEGSPTITLSTPDKDIAQKLQQALASPTALYKSLQYKIHKTSSVPQPEQHYPALPTFDDLLRQNIFEHLFSADFRKLVGAQWKTEVDQENGYVLYFPVLPAFDNLTQNQVELYRNSIASASLLQIRKALTITTEHEALAWQPNQEQKGVLANLADKIFYITKNEQQQTIACFDIKLLYRCLTPPTLSTKTINHETYEIEIDKAHLISYLSVALQEGFVLHEVGGKAENRDGTREVVPICFNVARAVPLENVLSFVLDVSRSMQGIFNDYLAEIKNFLTEIHQQSVRGVDFKNTTIRIRPFSDNSSVASFSLQQGIEPILKYLDTLKANGNTLLNGTIADELTDLQEDFATKNVTLVVFTDGQDNISQATALATIEKMKNQIGKRSEPPKIFTFGLGEYYNARKLDELGEMSGTKHIHLNVINEFKKGLSTYLDVYCQAVRLVTFVQESFDQNNDEMTQRKDTVKFNARIRGNQVVAATGTLTIPGTFTVNQQSFIVAKMPAVELTATDQLQKIHLYKKDNANASIISRHPLPHYQLKLGLAAILSDQTQPTTIDKKSYTK